MPPRRSISWVYVKDRRKAPFFRAGIRTVHVRPSLPTLILAGVGHSITQQGQKLAVGLGSARTTEAITPFPHGRLRGRRDAVAATDKKQSSPGWSRPYGFDGRERPMARPVAHHPGRGWGPRPAPRDGPLRADTQPATPREGPKERPRTHKLTAGGCRTGPTWFGRPPVSCHHETAKPSRTTPRRSPRPLGRGGCQAANRTSWRYPTLRGRGGGRGRRQAVSYPRLELWACTFPDGFHAFPVQAPIRGPTAQRSPESATASRQSNYRWALRACAYRSGSTHAPDFLIGRFLGGGRSRESQRRGVIRPRFRVGLTATRPIYRFRMGGTASGDTDRNQLRLTRFLPAVFRYVSAGRSADVGRDLERGRPLAQRGRASGAREASRRSEREERRGERRHGSVVRKTARGAVFRHPGNR